MSSNEIKNVVAAVIKKNNKYLITQRNKDKYFGLKWEFPGGKVEFNETFEQALLREINEELNISIEINEKIANENFKDDKINVSLHYFISTHLSGIIILSEHEDYKWIEKKDFHKFDFIEGDKKILYLL